MFPGNKYKKTTRPHRFPACVPCVDISVSVFYLPLCVSCSSPKIRSSISGRSGCWGIRKCLMCFHLLCFILCYSISSYAKKSTKILVKLHKCNNLQCAFLYQDIKIPRPADAARLVTCTTHAGGFSVWHVCASNVRVYPGGLLLDAKTFRNPVLKMWVKKGLLSHRAGI